jgi:hypothetical protein
MRPREVAGNFHLAQSQVPLSTGGRETRYRTRPSVMKALDSVFRGRPSMNGWKKSGLP